MRKLIITTAVAILATFTANAQKLENIKFSVNAGMNISSIKASADATIPNVGDAHAGFTTENKIGYFIGGTAQLPLNLLNNKLYGEVGLNYSNVGATLLMDSKLNLNFLTLPILAKYEITSNIFVKGGLSFSYLLSANVKVGSKTMKTISDGQRTNSMTQDATLDNAMFEVSLPLGAEYHFSNGVFVNVNYIIGFGMSGTNENVLNSLPAEYRNNELERANLKIGLANKILQLGVGYKF